MKPIAFGYKVLLLVALGIAVLAWERTRPKEHRYRHIEYAFLAICALAGAIYGLAVDMVTTRLSAEYFQLGKGLGDGNNWHHLSLYQGLESGFIWGAFAACAILVANRIKLPLVTLIHRSVPVIFTSFCAAVLMGALAKFGFHPSIAYFQSQEDGNTSAFMMVWMIHLGTYFGAILGVVYVCTRMLLKRES